MVPKLSVYSYPGVVKCNVKTQRHLITGTWARASWVPNRRLKSQNDRSWDKLHFNLGEARGFSTKEQQAKYLVLPELLSFCSGAISPDTYTHHGQHVQRLERSRKAHLVRGLQDFCNHAFIITMLNNRKWRWSRTKPLFLTQPFLAVPHYHLSIFALSTSGPRRPVATFISSRHL